MRANLKKIFGLAALGMTLLANTVPTWAGSVSTPEVTIGGNQAYSWAKGSMVGARYSADNTQYIGCFIKGSPDSSPYIRCFASDRAGNTAFCLSLDLRFVTQVQAMTDSSYISFVANRSNALCDSLRISDYSSQLK
ncbi:MAG TPA: hypothetical protein VKK81_10110 [Candidatus Binatia bacterium]|nr:hypothetical protein [Candidatus Binatia bacterium]